MTNPKHTDTSRMTEAEALDEAAKAAGWRDWREAHERTWELDGMRAHAATIMENAALKAENERLRDLLCLADELLMEAKGAFPLPGNPLRPAYLKIREVSGDDYTTRKSRARAALKEIEGD